MRRPGSRSRWSTIATIGVALLSTLWTIGPGAARAEDRWTTPYPGIRRLLRTASGPRRIHALEVDLCHAGISLRATQSGERRQTVPAFGAAVGAEAAVNGDFFSFETYAPSGPAIGAGRSWGIADSRGAGFLAFGGERVMLSPPSEVHDPLPAFAREMVGGHPAILRDGEIVPNTGDLCTVRHPRTAAGLSADRRTLYLVVIDGRSSSSIGMTCAEEAALLRDLGADDAINLDGGGSSTMWVRGSGIVNAPSDGTARVVANHLAIQATGSGLPTSCMPWEPEESEWMAHVEEGTTDLDGDGRADVCARAAAGIRCHLSTGAAFGDAIAGPELSDASGWAATRHASTIVMGDVDGDMRADLCARAGAGVRCWRSTGEGFEPTAIVGPELSNDAGWGVPEHYATIRLVDVDGDGRDDLCARAAAGMRCWRSTGDAFDGAGFEVLAAVSDAAGWDAHPRWSSLRMGDVDGDGLADLCGRGASGMTCWRSTGIGFDPEAISGPAWSDAAGWSAHEHGSTIRLADVDGDGRADLCARAAEGFRCHLSRGDAFGEAIVLGAMASSSGWSDIANHSTIRMPDLDGDGDHDVCARANAGIVCWPFEGDGAGGGGWGTRFDGPELSDAEGWGVAPHYRTIRFADVDGDGDDDLCARGASRVLCWPSEGSGFGAPIEGPGWGNGSGWAEERYHATIRIAGPRRAAAIPPEDADGGVGADASVAASDGGASVHDAGPAERDAGARNPRDPRDPEPVAPGCACTVAPRREGRPAALLACLALALAAARLGTRRGRRGAGAIGQRGQIDVDSSRKAGSSSSQYSPSNGQT